MTSTDPLMAAVPPSTTPAPVLIPLKGMRGAIARNMSAGWLVPRAALAVEVDMTACLRLRDALRLSAALPRLSVTPIILRAVAKSLQSHPYMNALMREGAIELMPDIHLGLAVSLDDGLAVPVIRNADQKDIPALAIETAALAGAARSGTLPIKGYQGGTFSVTNLGMADIAWFTPILNPPQVAIIGLSNVTDRAVVREGQIQIAAMTTLTLVFDHRAIDGYPAAVFLKHLKTHLESCDGL